jgi:DNA polymerase-3 subunit epsilon
MNNTYLFYDTETSGFISKKLSYDDPNQAWIVQLGAVLATKDEIIDTLDILIHANGRKIGKYAKEVHGFSEEDCDKKGVSEVEAVTMFSKLLKSHPTSVCHHWDFDSEFLDQIFQRTMEDLTDEARSVYYLQLPHFCTMKDKSIKTYVDARNKNGKIKWPRLEDELYKKLFGKNLVNAHNAMADAKATMECFFELQKRNII